MNTFAIGENCEHSRFPFLELMNLSNWMNLMKSYQYMDRWKVYLLMITTDKIRISPGLSFYIDDIDVYFSFLFFTTGNLQLLNHHLFHTHTSQINSSNSMNSTEC